jgi:hypothetical protein
MFNTKCLLHVFILVLSVDVLMVINVPALLRRPYLKTAWRCIGLRVLQTASRYGG